MTERLFDHRETKTGTEGKSGFKRMLGSVAIKATAVVALAASIAAFSARHEGQSEPDQALKTGQQYELVDNIYSDYNAVANPLEQSWCRWPSRWSLCNMAMRDLGSEALNSAEYVARTYGWSDHNGKADAFRHCFWSGLMERNMGYDTAKEFGDRHEYGEVEPDFERAMDLTNNEIGRQVGMGQASVYNTCVADARNGILVAFQN